MLRPWQRSRAYAPQGAARKTGNRYATPSRSRTPGAVSLPVRPPARRARRDRGPGRTRAVRSPFAMNLRSKCCCSASFRWLQIAGPLSALPYPPKLTYPRSASPWTSVAFGPYATVGDSSGGFRCAPLAASASWSVGFESAGRPRVAPRQDLQAHRRRRTEFRVADF
jgi:hypothetical protein